MLEIMTILFINEWYWDWEMGFWIWWRSLMMMKCCDWCFLIGSRNEGGVGGIEGLGVGYQVGGGGGVGGCFRSWSLDIGFEILEKKSYTFKMGLKLA